MSHTKNSRKAKILVISYLAAAFALCGGFILQARAQAAAYRQLLDNSYRHAFSELTTAVEELDSSLRKGVYATSPAMVSSLCTEIFGKAMTAQMAIGELPYGGLELEQTAAFIAKTGDYAAALSRQAADRGGYTAEERDTLLALANSASSLSALLRDLRADLYAGTVELEGLSAVEARLSAATESGDLLAGSAFQTIEADFPEVPTLIYDGPFSEHIGSRVPKVTAGLPHVEQGIALRMAADFLGVDSRQIDPASYCEGKMPTYGFSAAENGCEYYLELTQAGCKPVHLLCSRPIGESTMTDEEALQTAREYLSDHGFGELAQTYTIRQDGTLTINFAAVQGEVLCYPDLVKVEVALDNGQIMGLETAGYLMNHCVRELPQPAVTEEQARRAVPEGVSILSHRLALIPTGGENEVFCREFKCETADGRHILIYVNANTGRQEKILLLLEDENGTLAI